MMKLDVETLSTVPDAPPEAGPDRAFPPPAEPLPAIAGGDVVVAEDVPQAAENPITAHICPQTKAASGFALPAGQTAILYTAERDRSGSVLR